MSRFVQCFAWFAVFAASCQERPATLPAQESGPSCESRQSRLVQLIRQLPEQAMAAPIKVSLPTSRLGGALSAGPILEISDGWVALDGERIEAATHEDAVQRLRQVLEARAPQEKSSARQRRERRREMRDVSGFIAAPAATPPGAVGAAAETRLPATGSGPADARPSDTPPSDAPPSDVPPAASALPSTHPESAPAPVSAEPPAPAEETGPTQNEDKSNDRPVFYVAAAAETDMQTLQAYLRAVPEGFETKLLFGAPPLPEDSALSGHDMAARVFVERDPDARKALLKEGYQSTSTCGGVQDVVASVEALSVEERWPQLRQGMLKAVPACDCETLDSEALGYLLVAEQRAGGVAIGSLPIGFLEQERCTASMPLRTVQQVLGDIERFEEEFSGEWQGDALHFEEVLTSERLFNYLCVALPGETLAQMQRARRTLYLRTQAGCHGFEFEPLSPGAPMGLWRRVSSGRSQLLLHYRQFSEDLRVFGPAPDPRSNPTDDSSWECSHDFHLAAVEERFVATDGGTKFYFDEQSCRAARGPDGLLSGCVADLASRP